MLDSETILSLIDSYSYMVIFLCLFFGIVGIPAPEESLLFLIGILVFHNRLSIHQAAFGAFAGTLCGMLAAYWIGRHFGFPIISKYGKYVGLTKKRLKKAERTYQKNIQFTLLFGCFLPGIRQINPYFAGISKLRFHKFFFLTIIGTFLWTCVFIAAGYYAGGLLHVKPEYAPYVGLCFFAVFIIHVLIKFLRNRQRA